MACAHSSARHALLAPLLAAGLLLGCTGEVSQDPSSLTREDGGVAAVSDALAPDGDPSPTVKPPGYGAAPDQGGPDSGPLPTSADQGPAKDQGKPGTTKGDGSTPPPLGDMWSPWSDFTIPDLSLTKKPGGKCPCAASLVCMANTCRATCNKPTDPCGVTSNCPAGQACVTTNYLGKYVCLPGVGLGKPCAAAFCADNRVCGSVNKQPHICLSTCTKAFTACGKGGVCLKSSSGNCHFCTKP